MQDPQLSGQGGYRKAWDQAIQEFNGFGLAQHQKSFQIDSATSGLMFGFKANQHQLVDIFLFSENTELPFTCFYCLNVMDSWLDVFFW